MATRPGHGPGAHVPLTAPGGTSPADTPALDFQPPGLWDNPVLCGTLSWQPSQADTAMCAENLNVDKAVWRGTSCLWLSPKE